MDAPDCVKILSDRIEMIQPCKTVNPCPQDPLPLLGYSAETPDVLNHIGLGWSSTPPPLNFPFKNPSCFVALDVPVSTPGDAQVANLMAQAQARQCAAAGWTTPDGQPVITYQSSTQFVTETCPDGSTFTFGVVAGLFVDLTQAAADQAALSYCQRQVQLHVVCLSGTFPALCLNQPASVTITASGVSLGKINENVWAITSGELPPGMTLNGGTIASDSVTITGIPTTVGTYSFSVMVTTPQGDYMEKAFSLTVVGLLTAALFATQSNPFNFQLAWSGFDAPAFASFDMPPGLSLSASGVITGTPPTAGTFSATVQITDAVADCQQDITITVGPWQVYQVTPSLTNVAPTYFNNGANFPPGQYTVSYTRGAMQYAFFPNWYLNRFTGFFSIGFYIDDAATFGYILFPGTTAAFASQAAVESANAGAFYTWQHLGGPIGMHLNAVSPGNTPGSPSPTFTLTPPP